MQHQTARSLSSVIQNAMMFSITAEGDSALLIAEDLNKKGMRVSKLPIQAAKSHCQSGFDAPVVPPSTSLVPSLTLYAFRYENSK